MDWQFDCPLCRLPVTADHALTGRLVQCPHCQGLFEPPSPASRQAADSVVSGASRTIRFTFTCLRCGSALEGRSELSRRKGRCPTCGAVFVVPEVDPRTGVPTGPAVVTDDGELPTPMHAYAAAGEKAPEIRRTDSGVQVIVCPRCRQESAVDTDVCPRCGLPFTMEGAAAIAVSAPQGPGHLASLSLVLGILGLPSFCIPVPILGMAAVVLGLMAMLRARSAPGAASERRTAMAGILCGLGSIGLTAAYLSGNW
ncbi:MAG: DUF4190 domain-containing protein [Phycisphaerae bacterium]